MAQEFFKNHMILIEIGNFFEKDHMNLRETTQTK